MSDRPVDEKGMFFIGMEFVPTEHLKQSELNRLTVHLLNRFFKNAEGENPPIKEHEKTMLMLVQFLVNLDIRLTEEEFASIPDELRKYFVVVHRDGTRYRYGTRARPTGL